MNGSIAFPNLGIELEQVGKSIDVFGFEIAFYGIIIGLGMMLGVLVAAREAKRIGQDSELIFDFAIYALSFSVIGARLYYVIFSWDSYKDDLLSIFNLREGGLAIYGGVIGAIITVYVYCRFKKFSAPLLLDICAMGLLIGQILGRWGNFFNREAFGEYTNNLFAMRLPVEDVRAGEITEMMLEHMEVIDGIQFIQVHPTFLYESMWNVLVLIIIFCYRKKKKFDGELFLIYLLGYGIGRFFIEALRTDQLQIANGIAISQVVAVILVVFSLGILVKKHMEIRKSKIQ